MMRSLSGLRPVISRSIQIRFWSLQGRVGVVAAAVDASVVMAGFRDAVLNR
jgi:hypothetical protein